jgi:hypothetical protein
MDIVLLLFQSLLLGFIASRIAVMLDDFMQYREIFWFVKKYILSNMGVGIDGSKFDYIFSEVFKRPLKKTDIIQISDLEDSSLTKAEVSDLIQTICSYAENLSGIYAFILRLINCRFCLCIWTALTVTLICFFRYDLDEEAFLLVPIFSYLITEKL